MCLCVCARWPRPRQPRSYHFHSTPTAYGRRSHGHRPSRSNERTTRQLGTTPRSSHAAYKGWVAKPNKDVNSCYTEKGEKWFYADSIYVRNYYVALAESSLLFKRDVSKIYHGRPDIYYKFVLNANDHSLLDKLSEAQIMTYTTADWKKFFGDAAPPEEADMDGGGLVEIAVHLSITRFMFRLVVCEWHIPRPPSTLVRSFSSTVNIWRSAAHESAVGIETYV